MHPLIANGALAIEYRHLSYISGPLVVIAKADGKLPASEKEEMAKKVLEELEINPQWGPDSTVKGRIVSPEIQDDQYWEDDHGNKTIPPLHNFITKESLRLFGLLGWERKDFQVFQQLCVRWRESDMFS